MNLYKTIVKVYTTALEPPYNNAWSAPKIINSTGTGFCCLFEGKQYIITNAHVINHNRFIQIKLADANFPTKFTATVKAIGRDCDLAILEVPDLDFLNNLEALELSETFIKSGEKVKAIGFPIGGEECCQTDGVISRNEYSSYAFNHFNLFNTSIDAKISPGNSGGPVINEQKKVVGVVHQGNPDGKTLGQMIPLTILRHFLEDATKNPRYKGFPGFPIILQKMENPNLRKFYGMQSKQTGVLVNKTPDFSPAYNILEAGDILLEVNQIPIDNSGKISIPELDTPIDFMYMLHKQHIGDTVIFNVLRKKEEIILEIKLTASLEMNNLIPLKLNEINPSYFEYSGVIVQPLTVNYFNTFRNSTGINPPQSLLPYYGKNFFTTNTQKELLIIRNILEDQETQGYSYFKNSVIKTINGRTIKNLWGAIHAFKSNYQEYHIIKTAEDKEIIIKNLSSEENEILRERYEIKTPKAPQYSGKNTKWKSFMISFFKNKEQDFAIAKEEKEILDAKNFSKSH